MRTVIGCVVAAGLLASPAFAQTSPGTWNGLSDRFQIDTGYFRLSADTLLRYNAPDGGSGEVDFEQDLGLDEQVNTFWVDATWRVGLRHQLKLGFTRISRDRGGITLERDFTWGGEPYSAGLTTNSTSGSDILGGYYRFAIVRNDPTRGWGGMLGGLLMGGLVGSLLFGGMGGLAGPGLLDILLVGAILFFVVRYLRSRKMATQSAGSTAFSTPYQDTYPQERWGSSAYGPGPQAVTPPLENAALPPGFDQAEFMKGAKAMYTRLQESSDKRDLEDVFQRRECGASNTQSQ